MTLHACGSIMQGCPSMQRRCAAQNTVPPYSRAVAAHSRHKRRSRDSPAGPALLENSPPPPLPPVATPALAAGLHVQPHASAAEDQAEATPPAAQSERRWDRSMQPQPVVAAAGSLTPAVTPLRRLTAAPGTAASQAGADPRLSRLTQQLMQCHGRQAEMRGMLQREHEQGLKGADVRRLLTYLDRAGAPDVALSAFQAIKAAGLPWAGDAVLRTKLIKMHSRRAKDTGAALALYDEMRRDGVLPDVVAYNICLTAAGTGHHWSRVLSLLDDMEAAGVGWDAFTCSALLSACQGCGKWEQALQWFARAQDTPGLQLNVVHYTTLMSCLQKAGQWERSIKVFRQMEGAGIVPDVVAHNAAIAACAKGGDWEAGWAVFLAMKQAGLTPSTISYNALISACERCGQPDRALEVFASMQRRSRAPPNAVTFNTLISACAKAGRYAKAQELHAAMAAAGIPEDVFTLTALITACERIGHWQGAEEHFVEFQARGVAPNTVAYNRLISALGRSGEWQRAVAAFRSMQPGSKTGAATAHSNSSGAISGGTGSNTSRDSSSKLQAGSRNDSGSSKASRGSSIGASSSAGGSSKASSSSSGTSGSDSGGDSDEFVFAAYANAAPARPDRITYGSLIAALERGGQWERALAVFEEMQAAGMQPNGYIFTSLINACEKGGQWETAVRLFKLMQGQDIPLGSMAMVARKALYAFPPLIRLMPAPLLQAARATVDSGRAAREWIDSKKEREEES